PARDRPGRRARLHRGRVRPVPAPPDRATAPPDEAADRRAPARRAADRGGAQAPAEDEPRPLREENHPPEKGGPPAPPPGGGGLFPGRSRGEALPPWEGGNRKLGGR